MTSAASLPVPTPVRSTRPRRERGEGASAYSALLHSVRDLGMLRRRTGFYWTVFAVLVVALGASFTAFAVLGDSWWQLVVAGVLGIVFTQFAFLAHEASHRQVFTSGKWNDRAGRILAASGVGMSYSWWMSKHTRHHGNPNTIGKDPDIERDTVSFLEQDAAERTGIMAAFTRRQGWFLFPLMLLEGLNLHRLSFATLFGRGKVEKRGLEITLVVIRLGALVGIVFWFLPLGMAFAFLGVQLAVFGLYMGASFAPNHIGMAVLPHDSRVDFLSRQVLTSRNISGGGIVDLFMGGLNYQIEHHLFPSMPRPHLRHARVLVEEYCRQHGIAYTQTTLLEAYGAVIRHLNTVGLAARDPFLCPLVAQFRVR